MKHLKRLGLAFLLMLQPFYARSAEVSKSKTVSELKQKIASMEKANQAFGSKPSPHLMFLLSNKKQIEKMGLRKSGGGGVVDGGGGNFLNGTLLDLAQMQGLKALPSEAVVTMLKNYWGADVERWEAETPGMSEWLQESLALPWYLDSKGLSSKKCLYLSSQDIPICYNGNSILIQERAFSSLSEKEKARHILVALFTYHYVEVGAPVTPEKLLQFSQEIANLLPLGGQSSVSLAKLQKLGVLSSDQELEESRVATLALLKQEIETHITAIRNLGYGCKLQDSRTFSFSESAAEPLIKFVDSCLSLANHNETEKICSSSQVIEVLKKTEESCTQATERAQKLKNDFARSTPSESEIAFLWGAKVHRFAHCYSQRNSHGSPSLKECLGEETSLKATAEKSKGTQINTAVLKRFVQGARRLSEIEAIYPGFEEWLLAGFKVPWYLADKSLNAKACFNETSYEFQATPVACFNRAGVEISKAWFMNPRQSDENRFKLVLHELIRIRVTELSDFVAMSRLQQDSLVASINALILDSKVPAQKVYELMQTSGLIPAGPAVDQARMFQTVVIASEHLELIKTIDSLLNSCRFSRSSELRLKPLFKKQKELLNECQRFSKNTDPANLCPAELLQNRLEDYGKYCGSLQDVSPY